MAFLSPSISPELLLLFDEFPLSPGDRGWLWGSLTRGRPPAIKKLFSRLSVFGAIIGNSLFIAISVSAYLSNHDMIHCRVCGGRLSLVTLRKHSSSPGFTVTTCACATRGSGRPCMYASGWSTVSRMVLSR